KGREIAELTAKIYEKEPEAARINEDYSQRNRTAEELRAANEALTFYLNRYKRVKEKILPPGSWRENVVRRLAVPLLARREQRARLTGTLVMPATRSGKAASAVDPGAAVVAPPAAWCTDPKEP